jgi:hypothetical protein
MIITKSKEKTKDGLYVYGFDQIPQKSYIKIHNLFLKNDEEAIDRAEKILNNKEIHIFTIEQEI